MKDSKFAEFDLATTYQKLISPSKPRTVKACDFFKQPDLITPLKRRLEEAMAQKTSSDAGK